jgi:hypothetical protein
MIGQQLNQAFKKFSTLQFAAFENEGSDYKAIDGKIVQLLYFEKKKTKVHVLNSEVGRFKIV